MAFRRRSCVLAALVALCFLAATAAAGDHGLTVFWGRNKDEGSLREACDTGIYSTVIISFYSVFGHGKYWGDLSGHPLYAIGADIKHCRARHRSPSRSKTEGFVQLRRREPSKANPPQSRPTPAMPKNKGKGGKNRKRGKNEADDDKRELVFKEDGQEYAQVTRMLGNGRCEAICVDGTKRLCHIRGKMHKKVWIAAGDIVLVGLRDYQDDKADVILKYMNDEARLLKAYGELPDTLRLNEGVDVDGPEEGEGDSDYIQFEDEDIDKI